MLIGVPKEIKTQEYRVGLTPASVRELTKAGHTVLVETNAGLGIGEGDADYSKVGARITATAREIFTSAHMIVKVKEPQPAECALLRAEQTLFTYLHLAADPKQAKALMASGVTAIGYETVTNAQGHLPLLTPMSEVAGRMSVQVGAHFLEKEAGGSGILLGGVPGVPPARVVIIGGGVAGTNAAQMAIGMRTDVIIIDRSNERLRTLDDMFLGQIKTIYSTHHAIEEYVARADLVIGSVLIPGAAAPKLVTRPMVQSMRPGSVIIDIAIDQGGCVETSRPTTHDDPVYLAEGVVHYCVTNMPGAVARTSAHALNNATLPYVQKLAELGPLQALAQDKHLANGVMVHQGNITHKAVAKELGQTYAPFHGEKTA